MKFRYFITDKSNIGTLIIGDVNPQTMLLLLGMVCLKENDKLKIIQYFIKEFHFSVEAENIEFIKLNTDDRYPYTYYNLVDEGVADENGYLYANISDIKKHFGSNDSVAMLKSIDWKNIQKRNFS